MSNELDRIKQDLEVIHEAAGFGEPPLGREDIWANCLLGVLGLIWAVSGWLMGGMTQAAFTIWGLAVSLVGVLFYQFIFTRSKNRTTARERAYRWSWWMALVLGALIGGFYLWAVFFGKLKGAVFFGSAFLFSGALLVLLAVTDKWRLSLWGWAIPILTLGCLVVSISQTALFTLTGVAVCIGGFASAGIISRQLKLFCQNGKTSH